MSSRFLSKGRKSGKIGYFRGGAAVVQGTSRTTAVTLDALSGSVQLFSAAGSATFASFTVNNNLVEIGDVVVPVQRTGTDLYHINITQVVAGSFRVSFATTGGTTTETPIFDFLVLKGVNS